jgi:hypothetical protein
LKNNCFVYSACKAKMASWVVINKFNVGGQ